VEQTGGPSLRTLLEALRFVAPEPVSLADLAQILEREEGEVAAALDEWACDHATAGIRLQRLGNQVQLVSAPEAAPYIECFLGLHYSGRLSAAALETLAIVAYRQPVTRPAIEALRGVDCSGILHTLLNLGLIEERGRATTPGRPIFYGTTIDFLRHFGLQSLEDLPPLDLPSPPQEDV
jgi:segregation and condensation protein B